MINDYLYKEARLLGACDEGLRQIPSSSERELVEAYKRYIEFSIDKNWPSDEYIKENFNEDILHEKNVFIREHVNVIDGSGVIVLNSCTGAIDIHGYAVATIYVRGESNVTIRCSELSKSHIYVYDDAKVNISVSATAHAFCIDYGKNTLVTSSPGVIIKKRNKS